MEVIIHLQRRRPAARPDALDFLQRKLAVRRHAPCARRPASSCSGPESRMPPRSMQLMFVHTCTLYLPAGLVRSMRVVAEHRAHIQIDRSMRFAISASPPRTHSHLILRIQQHRNQRRALHRINRHQLVEPRRESPAKKSIEYALIVFPLIPRCEPKLVVLPRKSRVRSEDLPSSSMKYCDQPLSPPSSHSPSVPASSDCLRRQNPCSPSYRPASPFHPLNAQTRPISRY